MKTPRSLFLVLYACMICGLGSPGLGAQKHQRNRFTLKSEDRKTTYVVNVWLPRGYPAEPRPRPLLLMLDGEYAFNSAIQLSEYLQRNGEVEEFIIVGLSYDVGFGPPLAVERTRDFTPPVDPAGSIQKAETAYYRFIKDKLLPQLHRRYRIDPAQRTLWGYSLSGSFAAWLNYFDPTLFTHSILASGNLIDFGIMPKLFQGQIFSAPGRGGHRVLISYDASEIPDPKIVEDGRKLLASQAVFPGHEIRLFLTQGESHASSWFASLPTSLRFVFGTRNDRDRRAAGTQAQSQPPR